MPDWLVGLLLLMAAFGLGYMIGLRHNSWRFAAATRRINHAIELLERTKVKKT